MIIQAFGCRFAMTRVLVMSMQRGQFQGLLMVIGGDSGGRQENRGGVKEIGWISCEEEEDKERKGRER